MLLALRRSPSMLTTAATRSYFVRPGTLQPPSADETYTKTHESSEEFRAVERILGRDTVPPVPEQSLLHYPTPSGWIPPATTAPKLPYFIARTRYHNVPVYLELASRGQKQMTKVSYIQGDIWQLEKELKRFIRDRTFDGLVVMQVSEVNRYIKIKGNHVEPVKVFLMERGF